MISDNPLVRYGVFRTGEAHSLNWSGRGGGENFGFYLSFSAEEELGVLPNNEYNRYSGRVNFEFNPREDLRMDASVGLSRTDTDMPQNDNNIYGYLGGGLLGTPRSVGLLQDGWYAQNRQTEAIQNILNENMTARVTPSLTLTYSPRTWFTHRLTAGVDMPRTEALQFYEPPRFHRSRLVASETAGVEGRPRME